MIRNMPHKNEKCGIRWPFKKSLLIRTRNAHYYCVCLSGGLVMQGPVLNLQQIDKKKRDGYLCTLNYVNIVRT